MTAPTTLEAPRRVDSRIAELRRALPELDWYEPGERVYVDQHGRRMEALIRF